MRRARPPELAKQEFNFTVDCTAIGSGRRSVVGTQNTAFVNFAVANVTSGSTFGVAASGICTGLVTVRGANGTVDSRPFTIRVKVRRRLSGLRAAGARACGTGGAPARSLPLAWSRGF